MPVLHFSKYSACGNDFIMVDNRDEKWSCLMQAKLIAKLCHRRFGIGADGVILLCLSQKATIRMRYFNADGSEGEVHIMLRRFFLSSFSNTCVFARCAAMVSAL